jgi:hypothetical protein
MQIHIQTKKVAIERFFNLKSITSFIADTSFVELGPILKRVYIFSLICRPVKLIKNKQGNIKGEEEEFYREKNVLYNNHLAQISRGKSRLKFANDIFFKYHFNILF